MTLAFTLINSFISTPHILHLVHIVFHSGDKVQFWVIERGRRRELLNDYY